MGLKTKGDTQSLAGGATSNFLIEAGEGPVEFVGGSLDGVKINLDNATFPIMFADITNATVAHVRGWCMFRGSNKQPSSRTRLPDNHIESTDTNKTIGSSGNITLTSGVGLAKFKSDNGEEVRVDLSKVAYPCEFATGDADTTNRLELVGQGGYVSWRENDPDV